MYCDLQEVYWWDSLKRDIEEFVDKCPNFQQVKAEQQKSGGLTHVINVPTWKWEEINNDFIVGLPQTRRKNDSFFVTVDKLRKCTHFIPVKSTYWRRIMQEYTLMRL